MAMRSHNVNPSWRRKQDGFKQGVLKGGKANKSWGGETPLLGNDGNLRKAEAQKEKVGLEFSTVYEVSRWKGGGNRPRKIRARGVFQRGHGKGLLDLTAFGERRRPTTFDGDAEPKGNLRIAGSWEIDDVSTGARETAGEGAEGGTLWDPGKVNRLGSGEPDCRLPA